MTFILRYAVLLAFVGIFVVLATVALDKPGFYYDEVIFVPPALRVLGQCDVDAAVTMQAAECFPLMQTLGYVGAVKAWIHAPIFGIFGINTWTVRLPSILIAAATILILGMFVRRELGTAWAALLLALLATDPVILNHARLDWGPQVIAAFLRVVSLIALWRWLQTGAKRWLLIMCTAFLFGFLDKLNFLWVIAAWTAAGALIGGRLALLRLRDGRPWQPIIGGVTLALLVWGTITLVRRAAQLDILGDAGTLTLAQQVVKVWNLYAATFSGMSVIQWVFGAEMPVTSAFNILLIVQLIAAAVLLAIWRPWSPARRLLAFLTAATAFLVIAIGATRQVGGTHHLVMIWPMPALHLVTLLAITTQHLGDQARGQNMGLRATLATCGAVVWGALLAWNIAMVIRYIDVWENDRDYRPLFDPAIAKLDSRLEQLGAERVISVDWGLHQPLVTLADPKHANRYREWSWRLIDAKDNLARDDLRRAVDADVKGRKVAFVLHGPNFTVFDGARQRLDALLAYDKPCDVKEERFANAAGKPIYTIVIADFKSCKS
ncbi:MAG: glycosyltransferase family 39 protein [Burkholderiales bacterium]